MSLVLQKFLRQSEAKTGAVYFIFERRSQKTLREERFRKWLGSKSVLCFLLRCICRTCAVFRRNKVVLRRAVVNASLFVRLFNLFILLLEETSRLSGKAKLNVSLGTRH